MTRFSLISINAESIYYFLLYFFIPLIILFVVLIIMYLLYSRYAVDKNEHNEENIENDTNNFLTDLIFSDYTAIEMKAKINEFKKKYKLNSNLKKYILNKIIHIKENLNETNEHTILLIYKYFGFDEISNRLINST